VDNKVRVYADGFSAAIGWGEKPSRHDFNGPLLQIGLPAGITEA